MIVDTHCHASPHWYEPVEVLLAQMDLNDVRCAVLVQMHNQYDNGYQADCVSRYPRRLASVVCVDPAGPDPAADLRRLNAEGAAGIRLRASSGDGPTKGERTLWKTAAELGMSVSFSGAAAEFASDACAALLSDHAHLPVVLEHLGASTSRDAGGVPDDIRKRVLALSRFPNVYMKIHGIGEFARRAIPVTEPFPFAIPIPPRLREAYDAFGPERIMWGSNYPPVSYLEGYANALRLTMAEFADLPEAHRLAMFGGNAARVYGFAQDQSTVSV